MSIVKPGSTGNAARFFLWNRDAAGAMGHTFGVRVDGASPRRFLRFLSLTAFQAEGCGGGFAADLKKGARLAPRVVQKGCTPQGKRLTMICASLALLQIMFAVHPRESVSHDSQGAVGD